MPPAISVAPVDLQKLSPAVGDPLAIDAFDHIELWSANARQSAYFYQHAFGFSPVAYAGPETGDRDRASYVLSQGDITLVITTPLKSTSEPGAQIALHGDFVKHVALRVPNAAGFYETTVRRGAVGSEAPVDIAGPDGIVRRAAIRTYGNVTHPLIERTSFKGVFMPGFVGTETVLPSLAQASWGSPIGLSSIDHVVGNVELGKMEHWVRFYERTLGFSQLQHFSDSDISTEYSALMSKVMRDGTGKIKFPINEPATGKRKSQIEEYLEFNNGPGVQHIALQSRDIIGTVTELRRRGVSFLRVPQTYYQEVPKRVGKIKEDLTRIAELGILVDRDDDGYLLQIFTKPVQDRPTLFFEIIQREGSQGFGVGNFKALFEAIEREQGQRGNL